MNLEWRYRIGILLFAAAGVAVLLGTAALFFGWAGEDSMGWPIWLLAGPPEILCLMAAGILGKDNYQRLIRKVRCPRHLPQTFWQTSRFRYYTGLAGCLFNGVPITLYAYVPDLLPGGSTKMSILVIADLVFFASLLCAGGEFWEKLRRIFVWEGERYTVK